MKKCENCEYFQFDEDSSRQGQCRIDAPRVFCIPSPQGANFVSVWPSTKKDQWCAKYSLKLLKETLQ